MTAELAAQTVHAKVQLARAGLPKEIQVKVRLPKGNSFRQVTVNGREASVGGQRRDTVIVATGPERDFDIRVRFNEHA